MAQIEFEYNESNGWAIVDSQYIDAENAQNIHVAEGEIVVVNQKQKFYLNSKEKTICGEKLVKGEKEYLFYSTNPSKIRSALANLQNNKNEVCGICVSHFYADPEK